MGKLIPFIKNHYLGIFLFLYFIILLININSVYLFVGDEKRYSESVIALLDGFVDTNNHPLLAKTIWVTTLFISYSLFGNDKAIYWRIGTVLLSIGTLYVLYKIAELLVPKKYAIFAPLLLAMDPMYFVFSRLIQLDIPALFFSITAIYFFLFYIKKPNHSFLMKGSVFLGLSLACKLSGLAFSLFLPAFILFPLLLKRKPLEFILLSALYYMSLVTAYMFGNFIFFVYSNFDMPGFFDYTFAIIHDQLVNSRLRMSEIENTYQVSPAWTWFLIPQILSMYRLDWGRFVESVLVLQNPATFIISGISVITSAFLFLSKKIKKGREFGLLLLYLAGNYLPWFLQIHPTFYYYIIPLVPVIILFFIFLVTMMKKSKAILVTVSLLSLVFFLVYYPLLAGIKIPKSYDLFLYKYSQLKYPEFNWPVCQNCTPRK